MDKWQDPNGQDAFAKNRDILGKTKNQLHNNIEATMMRGTTLDEVDLNAEELQVQASMFSADAKKARQTACWNMWLTYIAAFLFLAVVIVIILAVAGVFN